MREEGKGEAKPRNCFIASSVQISDKSFECRAKKTTFPYVFVITRIVKQDSAREAGHNEFE